MCVQAVREAWEKRAPGSYAYGYGYAVVAHSRRVCYFDDVSKRPGAVVNSTHGVNGHAVMYGDTNDENFRTMRRRGSFCQPAVRLTKKRN